MFYVKISDSVGVEWRPYANLTDAQAYASVSDGEVYQDAKDGNKDAVIDKAVTAYLAKKKRHITVTAVRE